MSQSSSKSETTQINDVEVFTTVTEYTISAIPEGQSVDSYAWDVRVSYRGSGKWAVVHLSQCLGKDGEWDWERQPSSRTKTWLNAHRFTEQKALEMARKVAPTIRINGLLPSDLARQHV